MEDRMTLLTLEPEQLRSLTPDERRARAEVFDTAAKACGHVMRNSGTGHSDQAQCSCGWPGTPFFDGDDLARAQWQGHVRQVSGTGQIVMNFG